MSFRERLAGDPILYSMFYVYAIRVWRSVCKRERGRERCDGIQVERERVHELEHRAVRARARTRARDRARGVATGARLRSGGGGGVRRERELPEVHDRRALIGGADGEQTALQVEEQRRRGLRS